jgi:hypothetical protein
MGFARGRRRSFVSASAQASELACRTHGDVGPSRMLPSSIEVPTAAGVGSARGRCVLAVLASALSSLHAGSARGDDEARARWVYDAPPECPSSKEVDLALRARVAASTLESDPRNVVITISREGEWFVGRLTFVGEVGERVVRERTCPEAVGALVLFTAIALDPASSSGSDASPVTAPSTVAPSPPAPALVHPPRPELVGPTVTSGRRRPATIGLAAGAAVASGPVPGPAQVFSIAGTLQQPFTETLGAGVRLGASASHGDKAVGSGRLEALLLAGTAELTPTIAWRSFRFAGGPVLTLGRLSATGKDVLAAQQTAALWVDVGVVARAGVGFGILRFELYSIGAAPLTPRTYLLVRPDGERAVHSTPPLVLTVGGGVVVELGRGI